MPESYLDLFWIYCGIGAVTFPILRLFVYIFHRKESPSTWVQEAMAAFEKSQSLKERIKKAISWLGVALVVVLIWPITILIVLYAMFFDKQTAHYSSDEPRFTCQKKDLIKQVRPTEVEQKSYVEDPLGRVPNTPFGHLHQGWIDLLAQLEPDDQLWSFKTKGWSSESPDYPKYSKPQNISSGFAIVRTKKVVAEFVCGWD
jgi:hypothetical protein